MTITDSSKPNEWIVSVDGENKLRIKLMNNVHTQHWYCFSIDTGRIVSWMYASNPIEAAAKNGLWRLARGY